MKTLRMQIKPTPVSVIAPGARPELILAAKGMCARHWMKKRGVRHMALGGGKWARGEKLSALLKPQAW